MSARATAAMAAANIPEEARAVAGMLALPLDYPPVRVADTYSADETVLAQTIYRTKAQWDSGLNIGQVATGRQLPSNDWGAFIFPSLLRHTVMYTVLSTGTAAISWAYQMVPLYSSASAAFSIPTFSGTWRVEPAGLKSTTTIAPHGSFVFCGKADGRVGFWVDATADQQASLQINYSAPMPAGVTAELTLRLWDGGKWSQKVGATTASGDSVTTAGLPISGYYSLEISFACVAANIAPTISVANINLTCTCTSSWAHHPAADIFSNIASIGNARVLGLGALLQNEASVMNKQGNVVAVQAPPNRDWYTGYASLGGGASFYANLFNDKGATSFLLETGIYGFKRPKSVADFEFEQEVNNSGFTSVSSSISTSGNAQVP